MFSYVVALIPFFLILYNPIVQLLAPRAAPAIRRTPRPQLNEDLLALETPAQQLNASQCPPDSFSVHIFAREPLVLYIEDFLSLDERRNLLALRYLPTLPSFDALPSPWNICFPLQVALIMGYLTLDMPTSHDAATLMRTTTHPSAQRTAVRALYHHP